MLKKEHLDILDQLLRSRVQDIEVKEIKPGDFIRFFDYTQSAEGLAQVETVIAGEPNVSGVEVGPRKLIFSSSVLGRDYMMLKPNTFIRKVLYDPTDEVLKAKIENLQRLRKLAEKNIGVPAPRKQVRPTAAPEGYRGQ